MGMRAIDLFSQNSIKVMTGAPSLTPEELVKKYLDDTLTTGDNLCDH
jgi:predicted Fe-Mo cluster-binding NifX family protein